MPFRPVTDEVVVSLLLAAFAFLLAMLITPIYTTLAYKYKWWKKLRETSLTGEKAKVMHKLHAEKHKRNIPTMAGLIMVVGTVVTTLVFNFSRGQTYLPLAATLGAGLVGLTDDIINLRGNGKGVAGLSSKLKFLLITIVAALGGMYFYFKLGYDTIHIPFIGEGGSMELTIGALLIPLFTLVVVSTANAVNVSDGLDGLAGGLLSYAFSAYAVIALLQGNYGIAGFCATVVGTLLAYVWFNIFPARFFMGDVGSFALGTALGVVAMLTDTILLLPVIAAVFVFEIGTVLIQLTSKKLRNGKKIFLSTPIHHHFEAKGWPETKVTMRFWTLGQVSAILGIILAVVGDFV